jgi:hypothetical protein
MGKPFGQREREEGKRIPHLHCLLAPRFWEDVAPGDPLPGFGYVDFPEDEVRREVDLLRGLLAKGM